MTDVPFLTSRDTLTHAADRPARRSQGRRRIWLAPVAVVVVITMVALLLQHQRATAQSRTSTGVIIPSSDTRSTAPTPPPAKQRAAPLTGRPVVRPAATARPVPVVAAAQTTGTDRIVTPPPSLPGSGTIAPWAEAWNGGNLRAAPGIDASIIGTMPVGAHVRLTGWAGEWWRVHTDSGDGWLSQSLLIVDPEAIGHVPFVVQAAPELAAAHVLNGGNLRDSPTRTSHVVAGVDAGDVLLLVGQAGDWWHVRTAGTSSWIHRSLVALDPRGSQTMPDAEPLSPVVAFQPAGGLPGASGSVPARRPAPSTPDGIVRTAPLPAATAEWPTESGPGNLIHLLDVSAPHPALAAGALGPFNRARSRIYWASGVDYLGQLDDAFRSIGFVTQKVGVANRSWHKAGRAIDLAEWRTVGGQQGVVFIRDRGAPGLWRVLLRAAMQDGSHGSWYSAAATQGRGPAAFYVDVTTILEGEGWQRIGSNSGVTEAWHYQYTGGLTWEQAMSQLYSYRILRAFFPQ